jgi:hypothetical protein
MLRPTSDHVYFTDLLEGTESQVPSCLHSRRLGLMHAEMTDRTQLFEEFLANPRVPILSRAERKELKQLFVRILESVSPDMKEKQKKKK